MVVLYCVAAVTVIPAGCRITFSHSFFVVKRQEPVCRWTSSCADFKQNCLCLCTNNIECCAEFGICVQQDGRSMLAQLSTATRVASTIPASQVHTRLYTLSELALLTAYKQAVELHRTAGFFVHLLCRQPELKMYTSDP